AARVIASYLWAAELRPAPAGGSLAHSEWGRSMGRSQKIGECLYCGRVRPLTRDDVPPKNLFPKPRPSNLITVPSCQKCNQSFMLDDEYFRLVIADADNPKMS